MKFTKVPSKAFKSKSVITILLIVGAYFNLGLPTLMIFGIIPEYGFFPLEIIEFGTLLFVLAINAIYLLLLVILLKRFLPDSFPLTVYSSWPLLLFAVLFVVYSNFGNFTLSRDVIKSNTGILTVVGSSIAYTYLSAILLCETDRVRLFIAFLALIFATMMAFEREVILLVLFPVIIRLGRSSLGSLKTVLVFALGTAALALYKPILLLFRSTSEGVVEGFGNLELWSRLLQSLMRDNLTKSSLELFYFSGDAPNYNNFSYILPMQIERLLFPGAQTNGQLATEYYTQGYTGTGFSALLEAWLNLGIFGVFVLPVLTALTIKRTAETKSAFLFLAILLFFAKFQRSDLWPAAIGFLLGPFFIALCWKLLLGQSIRSRGRVN